LDASQRRVTTPLFPTYEILKLVKFYQKLASLPIFLLLCISKYFLKPKNTASFSILNHDSTKQITTGPAFNNFTQTCIAGRRVCSFATYFFPDYCWRYNHGKWVFLPMLTVSIAGACGGAFYYLADYFRIQNGWNKLLVNIVSLLCYVAGLWLSLVFALSLVGLWD
jgi:hypothetical protein